MKTKRLLSLLFFAALLPLTVLAATWQDPVTKVKYRYTVGNTTASVTTSSDATGNITILSSFTVDDNVYDVTSIAASAFDGCSGLTSITIPASVTTIGADAFAYCSGLTGFTIEAGSSKLRLNSPISTGGSGYALSIGRNLTLNTDWSGYGFFPDATSAELGGNMTAVNSNLFDGASKLASVNIGSGVTSIGQEAFWNSGLTSVTIPATVTTMGEDAFSHCYKLTEVVFSEGVTKIGGFSYCTNLTSVTIPSTVTTIAASAFDGCSGLTSITIPASVTTIGNNAFSNSGLTNVTIPATVTTIGTDAFCQCSKLTSFTIESGSSKLKLNGPINIGGSGYALSIGRNLTLNTDWSGYGFFPDATSAELGGNMTAVNSNLFDGSSKLASVNIGSGVTTIGQEAFWNCGLTSVTIPGSVTSIGEDAFGNCYNLTEVVFSEGVTKIGGFSGCDKLTTVTIPSTATTINNSAFEGCSSLTDVTIPASVTTIGVSAFRNCSGLTSFIIEPGDSKLTLNGPIDTGGSGYALSVGRNLTLNSDYYGYFPDAASAELGGNMTAVNSYLFYYSSKLGSVTIGSGVTTISENAFYISGLTSVTIPGSVTSIGEDAFGNCYNLTEVVFSEGVTKIGGFSGCDKLTTVTIPSTATTIKNSAFEGCSSLTDVTIPASVTTIGVSAFRNCSGLTSFIIEPGDSKLTLNGPIDTGGSGYALSVSRNLTLNSDYYGYFPDAASAELGGNMTAINSYLFNDASKLASVNIGSSVTSIGEGAFSNCSPTSVKMHHLTPFTVRKDAFTDNTYSNATLLVPAGTKEAYAATKYWKDFTHVDHWSTLVTLTSSAHGTLATALATATNGSEEYRQPKEDNIVYTLTADRGYELTVLTDNDANVSPLPALGEEQTRANANGEEFVTLAATFTPIVYTLSYELAGGTLETANPATYTVESATFTLVNPTRRGYNFEGWTGTDLTGPTKTVTIELGSIDNREYTATWSPIIYDIEYTLAGGTVATENPATYTIESETFTLVNPTRTGYNFEGWTGTDLTEPTKTVTIEVGNIGKREYIATWSPIVYDIEYELAGGTVATENPATYTIESTTFTLTNPTRTGYDFEGWTGTDLTEPTKTVTIELGSFGKREYTAVWTPIIYDIEYTLAGGTVNPVNPATYTIESETFTLNAPAKNGYTFLGWKENGEGEAMMTVTITKGSTGSLAYTATWTPTEYTIDYFLDGGTVAAENPTTYTIESEAITLNNPTKDHYDFAGWTGTDLDAATTDVTIATGNTGYRTYTATWTRKVYSVNITGAGVMADKTNPQYEDDVIITIEEDDDRRLTSFTVNGVDVTADVEDNQYTITNVSENINVVATFVATKEFITLAHPQATFCCSQDLDFTNVSGLKAYIASGFYNGVVLLTRVDEVPANTGLLLVGNEGETYKVPYATVSSYYVNLLKPVLTAQVVPTTTGEYINYLYGEKDGVKGFYKSSGIGEVSAQKAYLQLPSSVAGARIAMQFDDEDLTGIDKVSTAMEHNAVYDLRGSKVANEFNAKSLPKGIYIVNGKKVVVK